MVCKYVIFTCIYNMQLNLYFYMYHFAIILNSKNLCLLYNLTNGPSLQINFLTCAVYLFFFGVKKRLHKGLNISLSLTSDFFFIIEKNMKHQCIRFCHFLTQMVFTHPFHIYFNNYRSIIYFFLKWIIFFYMNWTDSKITQSKHFEVNFYWTK